MTRAPFLVTGGPLAAIAAVVSLGLWPGVSPAERPEQAAQSLPIDRLIQNGRVEHRQTDSVAREVAAVGASDDPVWVGWQARMIDGDRSLCNWYSNSNEGAFVRGASIEPSTSSEPPKIVSPGAPVPLEAGTSLLVLLRVVRGQVERIRTLGGDCAIDAGGRTVYWLDGVSAAASLTFLDTLTTVDEGAATQRPTVEASRSKASAAIAAIALHGDSGADAILERIASRDTDAGRRRLAGSRLGSDRGARGFEALRKFVGSEQDPSTRRGFVSAIGASGQPGAAAALLGLARNDADARVRSEAVHQYVRAAGESGVANALGIIERDADESVQRRAVSGLAGLPANAGVPHLIALARTSTNLAVRKEAVTALGRSDDPRARSLLEELIKR